MNEMKAETKDGGVKRKVSDSNINSNNPIKPIKN